MNIASFVNVLREEDLLYWFTSYVQENLVDRFPDNNSFDEIDDNLPAAELVRLVRCFVNDDGNTSVDDQVLGEIITINRLFYRASSIFHCDLVELGCDVEMYDELSSIFAPLFFDRFDRLISN
jgi:hypothetical protein